MHESVLNHDNIHKLVYALVGLHLVCWSSIYYVSLKYKLVCYVTGICVPLYVILDYISLFIHLGSFRTGSVACNRRISPPNHVVVDRRGVIFAVNVFETSHKDHVSTKTVFRF